QAPALQLAWRRTEPTPPARCREGADGSAASVGESSRLRQCRDGHDSQQFADDDPEPAEWVSDYRYLCARRDNPGADGKTIMRWLGAAPTLLLGCACMVQHEVGDLELPAEPGLPSAIAPLTVSVGPGYVVDCMATLVHPLWALTTAHCFASAPPESW